MDLLLTHGYFLAEDAKEQAIMKPYPPLGILYICSHLRAKGFDVEVFDSTFSSFKELETVLGSYAPGVLGVYANLMTRRNVVRVLHMAKQAGWRTIVGGPEPGSYVDEYLLNGADIVVIGEGEVTLEELLPILNEADHSALERVNGIGFRDSNGRVRCTPPRAQIPNIDAQPWPAREAIDIERYVSTWRRHHGQGSVSLITARGCPFHCRWCSHQVFGQTHRRRKPASVVQEVAWLMERYSPDIGWIADDVFTIHHGWLFEYAAEMKRRSMKLPFECISRADRINQRVVETLAELGCFRLWIGSESGSQAVLDAMARGVTVEQVQSAVAMCKSAGIQTGMFLMWGYEGEEIADIEATIDHVKRCDPDVFLTTVAYPIKGTPYFAEIAGRVIEPEQWSVSSDREFRIRNRHSKRFYSFADRLLRSEVELARRGGAPAREGESLQAAISEARAGLYQTRIEVEA